MDKNARCSSCGVPLASEGIATFSCPSCGTEEIGRCKMCRDQSVSYTCEKCGFQGP